MKILVVSNMYPDSDNPSYGIFVKRFVEEAESIGVLCDKSVMYKKSGKLKKAFSYITFYVSAFFKCLSPKYDIIYIHYASHSSLPVIMASRLKKLNIYTNVHGSDIVPENQSQENWQKYTKRILDISKKIIVPSEYFRDLVSSKYNIDKNLIYIYPSAGVNNNVFCEYSKECITSLKKDFGICNDYPVFGMAGRITANKGWKTFVDAILKMEAADVRANYIIVGEGPDDAELSKILKETGMERKIIRLGFLDQKRLADFYNVIDCFVFPTQREGESLGLVALEAMACGTPVISSDIAAPSYYVVNESNGLKFNPFSSEELFACMKGMADTIDCGNIQSFVDSSKKTAEKYFNNNISVLLKEILLG